MRGLVKFEAAGQEYALQFTNNRLCQLEEDSGESVMAIFARLQDEARLRMKDVRLTFRAGLIGEYSLEAVGDIIDLIGINQAMEIVGKSLTAAFDQQSAEVKASGKPKAGAV